MNWLTAGRAWSAPLLFVLLILVAVSSLRRAGGRRLALLWPIGVGILIAWQALLLNALSLFNGVTVAGVVLGNLAGLAALAAWMRHPVAAVRGTLARTGRSVRAWRAEWLIVPLAAVLAAAAVIYPPTTHDAMTYHMARVAHWMQNQSIAYYPTCIDRQNWISPGAEYLILPLQLIAASDRWANSVQWLAWLLCVAAVPALCRAAGVPQRLAPWAAVLVAGLPMGVLQATSTQTDLVASLMTLGILSAALPLLHAPRRWQRRDIVLTAVMLAAAYLVKPSAVLAASPLLIYVAWCALRRGRALWRHIGPIAVQALLGVVLAAGIEGPDLLRRAALSADPTFAASRSNPRNWSYGLLGEWRERLLNPLVATYAHHSLGQARLKAALEAGSTAEAAAAAKALGHSTTFILHEDFVGNPVHMVMAMALLAWVGGVGWRLRGRRVWFALMPFAGWLILHAFVRNQVWISRLQLPLFFMLPLAWTAGGAERLPLAGVRRVLLILASLAALGYGYYVAAHNRGKPITPAALRQVDRDTLYYIYRGMDVKAQHDAVLAQLRAAGAERLGLLIGGDDYDYPLTWRAMRQGIAVRHYTDPSIWPDMVFSPYMTPPSADPGLIWKPFGTNGLYAPVPARPE